MIRRIIAAVVCSAAMLAYWLGYGAILNGSAFGVPFGWAFGAAATFMLFAVPLTVDRDDPAMLAGRYLPYVAMLAVGATAALFGAGIVLHASQEYWLGGLVGAIVGGWLVYWANGDDRKQRGVPRVTSHGKAASVRRPLEREAETPQALQRPSAN